MHVEISWIRSRWMFGKPPGNSSNCDADTNFGINSSIEESMNRPYIILLYLVSPFDRKLQSRPKSCEVSIAQYVNIPLGSKYSQWGWLVPATYNLPLPILHFAL